MRQVRGIYLPDTHENKLMVGMSSQKHGKKFGGIFFLGAIPGFLKVSISMVVVCCIVLYAPKPATNPYELALH